MKYYKNIRDVLIIILVVNVAVAAARIVFGYNIKSSSMIADGLHALTDGFSNVVALVGIWLAVKPADHKLPYGYRKFETIAIFGIAVILSLGALEVLRGIWQRYIQGIQPEFSWLALYVLLGTIVINCGIVYFEKKYSKKFESDVLFADSEHTAADLLVSSSVVISLFAIKFGYPIIDTLIAIVIVCAIGRMAFKLFRYSTKILVDSAVLSPKIIEKEVCGIEGILGCHAVKSRGPKSSIHVDMHIMVEKSMSVEKAHNLAHKAEKKIKQMNGVTEVTVHIEPG